jgi:hypothetical protein
MAPSSGRHNACELSQWVYMSDSCISLTFINVANFLSVILIKFSHSSNIFVLVKLVRINSPYSYNLRVSIRHKLPLVEIVNKRKIPVHSLSTHLNWQFSKLVLPHPPDYDSLKI